MRIRSSPGSGCVCGSSTVATLALLAGELRCWVRGDFGTGLWLDDRLLRFRFPGRALPVRDFDLGGCEGTTD
jgi:hypothetical protein